MILAGSIADFLIANSIPVASAAICPSQDTATWPNSSWFFRSAENVWVRVDWSTTPTTQQQTSAGTLISGYDSSPPLDDKLAQLQQVAKTVAAIVELLVAQFGNTPPTGTPVWAKTQLASAHTFIKNQGG